MFIEGGKLMPCAAAGSGVLCIACAVAFGQATPEGSLAFEVASIKSHSASTSGRTGIEEDAGQIRIENLSLRALIGISYGVKGSQQLAGPRWLDTVTFDIVAKPPVGSKHEQLQFLLRNLLADASNWPFTMRRGRSPYLLLPLQKGAPNFMKRRVREPILRFVPD
jgi:uncharacterized protein (TIGR03435 family)